MLPLALLLYRRKEFAWTILKAQFQAFSGYGFIIGVLVPHIPPFKSILSLVTANINMNLVEISKPFTICTKRIATGLPILSFQAQIKDYLLHNSTDSDLRGYDGSWNLVKIKILIHRSGLRPETLPGLNPASSCCICHSWSLDHILSIKVL